MKHLLKSLEYNIVWTCINSCASCSHLSPVNPVMNVTPETFRKSLTAAARIIEAETFTLLGGEPLLHPDLVELIFIAKESGISNRVQVTTNGRLLDQQSEEFWRSMDSLRVTRYPGQVTDEQWARWKLKCEVNGVEFHGGMNAKFYKPISEYELDPDQAEQQFHFCPWKSHCTTLDEGRLYICPQALFFPVHFKHMLRQQDSLSLEGASSESVAAYMQRSEALKVCSMCSYSSYAPWLQVPRSDWFKESVSHA